MNTKELKYELINKIMNLNDTQILSEIDKILNTKDTSLPKKQERVAGCGKGIFTYISDDFNEPLDDFKEYMP